MDLRLKPFNTATMGTDMDMDVNIDKNKRLKPCTSTTITIFQDCSDGVQADRLTTLPVELIIRILNLLPTKDAAATCFLSKRMMKYVFPWITSLDLDDSPIAHCSKHGSGIEHFPSFVTFVDFVLKNHESQYLTRFRLGVGPEHYSFKRGCSIDCSVDCEEQCSPDLKPMQINAWISFPLTRCGLRELDLRLRVREVGDVQLSPDIFTCETLEVLKLDTNLGFNRASTVQTFHLPNLKLFHLLGVCILEDDFLTRLVSSCPLLEDLDVKADWNYVKVTNISSPSLRRMCLYVGGEDLFHNTDSLLINTPNLEFLKYVDNLAYQYSITNMDRLVEADISIENELLTQGSDQDSFQQMLRFIRPLSNVQHLALKGMCTEVLKLAELENHQLPVFHNLKSLELQYPGSRFWDNLLLPFLNCSPALETLVFPYGFREKVIGVEIINDEEYELERELCRTALANIPSCCRYHLKRIVIKNCFTSQREIDLIQFLLRHALVLEELVIDLERSVDQNHLMTFESTLQNLPKASVTCSIQVQKYTPL